MIDDFYEVTTDPLGYPVLFSDAAEWGRDIPEEDQSSVEALIGLSTKIAERITNRNFVDRSITGKFSSLWSSKFERHSFVQIRRAPLKSVDEVRVNGSAILSTEYIVKNTGSFPLVLFKNGLDLDSDYAYPIEIDFKVGYGCGTALSISSLTLVGTTVTAVTETPHYFSDGDKPTIAGAEETEYNGQFPVTVVDDNTFTYEITGSPTTPATGTITSSISQPDWVKIAIQQLVLFWYENRGDVMADGKQSLPNVAKAILKQHRILNTFG